MSRRRRLRLARSVSVVILLGVAGLLISTQVNAPRQRASHDADDRVEAKGARSPVTRSARKVTVVRRDLFDSPTVAAFLATQSNGMTAAVYDDVNGDTSLYRPGVAEDTASIMKVDILATLLSEAQAQDQPLTSDEQELSEDMIEESDNDDAQDLWDAEGGAAAVSRFDTAAGLTETTPDEAGYWGLSTTTAADQVQLLKAVAYPNSLLSDASRQYELGLMTSVDPSQAWGISAGVEAGATVAIKNGWLPLDSGGWQINSIGYVDGDGRNYLVAVLSNGNSTEAQGIDSIESLSQLIWKELGPATG